MPDEPTHDEQRYDKADLKAWSWAAEHRLMDLADKAERVYGLDPMLADRLRDAERAQDADAFYEALADVFEAVVEAREERGL